MGPTDESFGEHSIRYHWPQELLTLIIDVVPKLFRSKKQVLVFFRGAGVGAHLLNDLMGQLNADTTSLNKYQIARTVATRLLERGDTTIAERREIVKQLAQWEDYSGSYPDDAPIAKGLIASIRELVKERDAFTRMADEREREREINKSEYRAKIEAQQKARSERESIKSDLFALFPETNASKRGKALEGLLNRLFKSYNILVSEAFELKGDNGEGVIEQIDGVISLDGEFYLVEMKWWKDKLGPGEVSQHLVRVFSRGQAGCIDI